MAERSPDRAKYRRLRQIPGVESYEIPQLAEAFSSRGEFESLLDSKDAADSIHIAADASGMSEKRLMQLLALSLSERRDSLTDRWLARHWLDALFVAVLVAIVALPFASMAQRQQAQRTANALSSQPRVTSTREILPFVPLQASDLQVENSSSDNSDAMIERLVGRYATSIISEKATVSANQLSAYSAELGNDYIIRIELKQSPAVTVRSFPVNAKLILSSRDLPAVGTESQIRLLDLSDSTAILAVPAERMAAISDVLGSSDAWLYFSASEL